MWNYCEPKELIGIERIYTLFERVCPCGYDFPGESHNFWECVYVARGSVCVSADERVYELCEGQIIFHKPLELHKFFVNNKNGAVLYIFSYTPKGTLAESLVDKVCFLNGEQRELIERIFSLTKAEYEKQIHCHRPDDFYNRIYVMDKNPMLACLVALYISELLILLAVDEQNCTAVDTYDANIFKRAVDRMKESINTSLTVPELAHDVGVSESTLKRCFDKYARLSVYKYFLLMKIKNATIMLQAGQSVSETAERLGFSSQAYFSACYKRETGQNPSQVFRG